MILSGKACPKDFRDVNNSMIVRIRKVSKNCTQRAGIADGGEFYIRPPGTTAD